MSWIARGALAVAAAIAAWFLPPSAVNFPIVQMTIAVLLLVLVVIVLAFWRLPGRGKPTDAAGKKGR